MNVLLLLLQQSYFEGFRNVHAIDHVLYRVVYNTLYLTELNCTRIFVKIQDFALNSVDICTPAFKTHTPQILFQWEKSH